ncbi:MAG: hypothetical protein M1823_000186 [Watsoniomyces obsoletus]|nr:MAG: hypothetical protein M1823_000186 [Watsoniomyces obsoletus]
MSLREQARERSHHLDVSSLDVDLSEDAATAQQSVPGIPASLATKPRNSLRDSVQRAQQFRLDGLVTSFAEPLQDLLGPKQFLITDAQISTLDCLVSAYLCLALLPGLPQPWLADTLRRKFRPLCDYANLQRSTLLAGYRRGSDTEIMNDEHLAPSSTGHAQESPDRVSRHDTLAPSAYISLLFERTIRSIPFLETHLAASRLTESFPGIEENAHQTEKSQARILGISAAVAAATAGAYLLTGPLLTARRAGEYTTVRRLDSFGEVGAALAILPSSSGLR